MLLRAASRWAASYGTLPMAYAAGLRSVSTVAPKHKGRGAADPQALPAADRRAAAAAAPFTRGRLRRKISGTALQPMATTVPARQQMMNWQLLRLSPEMQGVVRAAGMLRPTEVQQLALPVLRGGASAACAAATGTGKTMAYLMPLIEALHRHPRPGPRPPVGQPRMVVLAPSQALAAQIADVAKTVAKAHRLWVCPAVRGYPKRTLHERLRTVPYDIVVATPQSLRTLVAEKRLSLRHVQHVVVDEADSLLEARTRRLVESLLHRTPKERCQFVFVAATVNTAVTDFLDDHEGWLGRVERIAAQNLHRLPRRVAQQFVICKRNRTDKLNQLLGVLHRAGFRPINLPHFSPEPPAQVVSSAGHAEDMVDEWDDVDVADMATGEDPGPVDAMPRAAAAKQAAAKPQTSGRERTVVFCNTIEACDAVSHYLQDKGLVHARFHGSMDLAESQASFKSFVAGEVDLLVTTDVASRGLDILRVQHVVMFDYPLNVADYLHRLGRTGRMGQGHGKCTALISRHNVPEVTRLVRASRQRLTVLEALQAPQPTKHRAGKRRRQRQSAKMRQQEAEGPRVPNRRTRRHLAQRARKAGRGRRTPAREPGGPRDKQ